MAKTLKISYVRNGKGKEYTIVSTSSGTMVYDAKSYIEDKDSAKPIETVIAVDKEEDHAYLCTKYGVVLDSTIEILKEGE